MKVVDFGTLVRQEFNKAVIGQDHVLMQVLVAILANGHVLLEGVPGIAKTLMVRTVSSALSLQYSRIQFTPDLMPSDVIGTNVFNQQTSEFTLRTGPIFTNVLLADEINRTPPKTQASLLEAMEERQATIDGVRYQLPLPFLVFATQNPIEFEGTYPLPEAQQDRFLLKVLLEYPEPAIETEVFRRYHHGFRATNLQAAQIQPVVDASGLADLQEQVNAITVEDRIFNYIQEIVSSTRKSGDLLVGASPRAGIALVLCSKALAALRGREFVIPDDVKDLALPVLRHRVMLRPEVEIEGLSVDRVLSGMIDAQIVPR
ncbi:MAG: MoxR family ATPase [Armatimonadetes bacterium]|nr:MoxR family ATPase [Armatimonadota bacterium]